MSCRGILLLFALLIGAAGCGPQFGMPQWCNPGSAAAQQNRAVRFDPYIQNDELGLPSTATRPRDYEIPMSSASRSRWYLGKWGQASSQ